MSENKHTLEPVALTHAAWLEKSLTIGAREAASELRRLHEVEKQRDELLAALEKCRKELSAWMRDHGDDIATQEAVADARAAIAKATGQ